MRGDWWRHRRDNALVVTMGGIVRPRTAAVGARDRRPGSPVGAPASAVSAVSRSLTIAWTRATSPGSRTRRWSAALQRCGVNVTAVAADRATSGCASASAAGGVSRPRLVVGDPLRQQPDILAGGGALLGG